MPPTYFSSTSCALYRVFVAPNLRATALVPLLHVPAFAPVRANPSQTLNITSRTSTRTIKYTKDTRRHALSDYYVLDAAIEADRVNLVDEIGKFHTGIPIQKALSSFNKVTHHLVLVSPGKVTSGSTQQAPETQVVLNEEPAADTFTPLTKRMNDEFREDDPQNLPTCRLISKIDLRAQYQRKLEAERRQAKGQNAGLKTLELNWAIAGGDLKYRLEQMKAFLKEGKKVELILAPKKRGRKATVEEASTVMKAVREAVAECKGTGTIKSEGTIGAVLTTVFQGKKIQRPQQDTEAETASEIASETTAETASEITARRTLEDKAA